MDLLGSARHVLVTRAMPRSNTPFASACQKAHQTDYPFDYPFLTIFDG